LKDLSRQGRKDFLYVWDSDKAQHIIDFAETLTLAEGDSPGPLTLKGFQDFVFGSWNGWVNQDGYRRFRTSYEQIARQNGKSIGNAVPAQYYGNFAGYQYPQIYATATKELQAKIVLKECYKFIKADPELAGTKTKKGLFTIRDYKSEIDCNLTHGLIKALGRDTESIDGFRPYFGSVDEYHKHKTNQMYKLLSDGGRNMKETLISIITTAGFDLNSPCKEEYDYAVNVLNGIVIDDTHFVFICDPDKGDDIWSEETWHKGNPLWTPEILASLRADAVKAKKKGGEELRNFMTKGLNIWVQATDNTYLNPAKWAACASDTTLDDMRGRECYLGLDLSSGGDLTTGNLEFPIDVEGKRKYFIDSHSFMPSSRLAEHEKTDKAPYRMWVRDGLITLTETMGGVKTDYKYIIAHYKDLIAKYDLKLKGIGYDPHNADAFLSDLESFGVDCTMVTQSARNLHTPTEDFMLEVEAENVIYDRRNALLAWSFGNASVTRNSFKEMKIDKLSSAKRIDPCDAVIDSHKLAMIDKPVTNVDEFAEEDFLRRLWG
jgi:phage terminase large subunit-like protein